MEQEKKQNINIIGSTRTVGAPIAFFIDEQKMYVFDNAYNFFVISLTAHKITSSSNLLKNAEPLHKFSKAISISNRLDIAFCQAKSTKATILSLATGSLAKKSVLNWHEKEIEVSTFSNDSRLFATGGAEGRTLIFDASQNFKIAMICEKRNDYISALAFSLDDRYLLAAGFDKSVCIYDLERNMLSTQFALNDVVEKAEFVSFDRIYLVTRGGSSIVYDLVDNNAVSTMNYFTSWPVAIKMVNNKKSAIIGTKNENLYIVNMDSNALVMSVKLQNISGISSIELVGGVLILGYSDGTIEFVEFDRGLNDLNAAVASKSYQRAADMIGKNCFLASYPFVYQFFEDGWKEVAPKVSDHIIKNEFDNAMKLATPFLSDQKKAAEVEFYMSTKKEVAEFAAAVEKKDVIKAYAIANLNGYLKKLKTYGILEEYWQKLFSQCKKLLEESPNNKRKVQEYLKSFAQVEEKKKMVYNLLNNCDKFGEAESAVKAKDFELYFSLVDKNPFLKETDIYARMMAYGQSVLDRVQAYEIEGKVDLAMKSLEALRVFKPFAVTITVKEAKLAEFYKFFKAVDSAQTNEGYIKPAFDLAIKNPSFQNSPKFIELTADFKTRFARATNSADNGKPAEIPDILGVYMRIDFYRSKVKQLFKSAYIREIELSDEVPSVNLEATFKKYIAIFSKELELEKVAAKKGLTNALAKLPDNPTAAYTVFDYPKSILAR